MKYTIQVFSQRTDDDGKGKRFACAFWTESDNVGAAYEKAEVEFPDSKFGFIIPGHHQLT